MGPEKWDNTCNSTVVMNNDGTDYGLTSGYLKDKMYTTKAALKKFATPEGGLLEEDDEETGLLSSRSRPLII